MFATVKSQFDAQLYNGRSSEPAMDMPPNTGIVNGEINLTYYVPYPESRVSAVDCGSDKTGAGRELFTTD